MKSHLEDKVHERSGLTSASAIFSSSPLARVGTGIIHVDMAASKRRTVTIENDASQRKGGLAYLDVFAYLVSALE